MLFNALASWTRTRESAAIVPLAVALFTVAFVVLPQGAAAQCTAALATTQPAGPPPPPDGGNAPGPKVALNRPGSSTFYLLYDRAIMDGENGAPLAGQFGGGAQAGVITDGVGGQARFDSISAGILVESLTAIFVIDRTSLRKFDTNTRTVTTLIESSALKTTSRLASNNTHLFITGGSCVLVANVNNATVRLTSFIGSCTDAKVGAITSPQPISSAIPSASVIVGNPNFLLFFVATNQFLLLPPDRNDIAAVAQYTGTPDVLIGLQDAAAFVDGSCTVYSIKMGSSGVITPTAGTVASPPPECASDFVGMRAETATGVFTLVNRDGKAITVSCGAAAGASTTSASAAASSSDDKTTVIVVATVVSAVVVIGVVVAIVIVVLVVNRKKQDATLDEQELKVAEPGTASASPLGPTQTSSRDITPIVVTVQDTPSPSTANNTYQSAGTLSASMITIPTLASTFNNEPVASNSLKKSQQQPSPQARLGDSTMSNLSSSAVTTTKLDPANYSSPDAYKRDVRRIRYVESGEFQKGKLIGRGANGAVYSVLLKDGSTIAMKEVSLMGNEEEMKQMVEEITREHRLLSQLHHPNLVKYYGVSEDSNAGVMRLFMENVTGGALGGMVRGMSTRLAERPARKFTYQITAGLAFIHNKGIVHRDLKCDNILRDANTGDAKLADFGTAKNVGMASRAASTMIGTPYFMAPEILMPAMSMSTDGGEDGFGYGAKADVWSLGILVAEMMNQGNPPWPAFPSPGHAFLHIANPDSKPDIPQDLSPAAKAFIARCTQRDPRLRPSAEELLSDPWLQGANAASDNDSEDD